MTIVEDSLDQAFHALANPTRRAVVARLGKGPASVTELAEPFEMALPSFMQHLRVLEDCGLVSSRKRGRVRTVRLRPPHLRRAEAWLSRQRDLWENRLDRLDGYVSSLEPDDDPAPPR